MGRFPSPPAERGSQRWMQLLVNRRPDVLADQLAPSVAGSIEWLSPLESDEYAEYRDAAALTLLGLRTVAERLREFWPIRGPQWDALGRTSGGDIILVEAKAHIAEMISGPSQARDPKSVALIDRSLEQTADWLRAKPVVPWNGPFYQMANRLAHLYFLREIVGVPAHLVFIYFVGDVEMRGPNSLDGWEGAVGLAHRLLGINKSHPFLRDVMIPVAET